MKSKLNGDEQKAWRDWYRNPRGADEHITSAGSRARAVSFSQKPAKLRKREVDDIYERMVRRGVVKG